MTKLTTERLEKLQDDLLQFQDHYSDPADKENYDIFVDALHMLDEFKAAKEKLMAYEQAAKKPIGSFHISGGQVEATTDYCRDGEWPVQDGEVLVYAAPVLPKQPVKPVMFIDGDISSDDAEKLAAVIREFGNEPAPAQPVIEPYKLEIDMDDADHFSITHLHEIIYGKELIWPEAKLLARFMLDVKQRASASPAQDDKSASTELPNHSNLSTNFPVIPDGWKLVPIEPTPKMRVSGKHAMKGCESIFEGVIAEVVYGAMVNAAPAQESE